MNTKDFLYNFKHLDDEQYSPKKMDDEIFEI